jgi:hypothetical protein
VLSRNNVFLRQLNNKHGRAFDSSHAPSPEFGNDSPDHHIIRPSQEASYNIVDHG